MRTDQKSSTQGAEAPEDIAFSPCLLRLDVPESATRNNEGGRKIQDHDSGISLSSLVHENSGGWTINGR